MDNFCLSAGRNDWSYFCYWGDVIISFLLSMFSFKLQQIARLPDGRLHYEGWCFRPVTCPRSVQTTSITGLKSERIKDCKTWFVLRLPVTSSTKSSFTDKARVNDWVHTERLTLIWTSLFASCLQQSTLVSFIHDNNHSPLIITGCSYWEYSCIFLLSY